MEQKPERHSETQGFKPSLANYPFAFTTADRGMTQQRAIELLQRNLSEQDEELLACIPGAQLSTSLKIQLAWLRSGNSCAYGGKVCSFDQRAVIDELAHLECTTLPTRTGPAEPLRGMLEGFWNKHFFEARFLAQNLLEETKRNFDTLWYRDFVKAWQADTILKNENNVGRLTGLLAQTMVHGAIRNRSGTLGEKKATSRLTGEWIVFAKHNGRNVYLTLGIHTEANESIALRIWQCGWEFPFVLEVLKSNGVEITFQEHSPKSLVSKEHA